jgi:hypothetical protein
MNWYKVRVSTGKDEWTYVGSSSDSLDALVEKAQRGQYLRLDNSLFNDRGLAKDWAEWDSREQPTACINPAHVLAIQP